ncbi:MAG: SpoIIE family protein phosphatase [Syntrophomonas sp.]
MLRKLPLAWSMTILVLIGAGCILGAVIGFSYLSARNMLEEELQSKALYTAQATAYRIETVQHGIEITVQGITTAVESSQLTIPKMYEIIERTLKKNPEVYGAAVALDPNVLGNNCYTSPYVYRQGSSFIRKDLGDSNYKYNMWDWYTLPREMGHPVWSEPYFDESGGGTLLATYGVPFFAGDKQDRFLGVITSDVSLDWLGELLASLNLGKSGYAFIISSSGTFISHPERTSIMNETIFSLAERQNDQSLRDLGRKMIHRESGFVPFKSLTNAENGWLAYVPVPSTGWSIGVFFPREELMARVLKLSRVQFGLGICGFLLLLLIILIISRSITQPLRQLDEVAQMLAGGNMDPPIPLLSGDDEIAHLCSSFDVMRNEIKLYMEMLEETVAAKERVESELRIANSIQMSLVPKTFPPFPDRRDFELYALMDPAKEVGGDLYDFFMTDDEHIFLAIGDVSGKGVPAALFMAETRSFLRAFLREEASPGSALARLNEELVEDNDSCMFATIFCAIIHLPSGECRYASAGHNPPFIISANGGINQIPHIKGTAVGVLGGLLFEEKQLKFEPGDTLYLYTDGVTEAMNREGELYGEEATSNELARLYTLDCTQLLQEMRQTLINFSDGAEQSDDITMLSFRFFGPGKHSE